MSYLNANQDVEYIREVSDQALDLMSEYNVIPSPPNYQIWYNYAAEEDMSLTKAIDDLIRKKKAFTSEVCANLHEKFFSTNKEHDAVSTAGKGIQKELTRLAKTVGDMNKDTFKYSSALSDSLEDISSIPGGQELKLIITSLLENTSEITTRNTSAQKQLKDSTQTVQKLQAALEAVRQESLTDMLTNIGNRKYFEESLQKAIADDLKTDDNLCLVIGDIDHFKKFNDSWGHHVGDQVLKAVAHSIKTRIGDTGMPARYGGEEFVIVIPDTTLEKAQEISENVRQSIAQRSMKRKSTGESIGKITCSFGIAQYRPGEHRTHFLERADAALYKSKSMGRNRVTLEEDAPQNVVKMAAG